MAILEARDISILFGGLKAVSDFNLKIEPNELVGLIGPNGAGKTTVFNIITGVYTPTSGDILFNSNKGMKSIKGLKPFEITRKGMARTFQNIRLFKELSVLDNVKIAFHNRVKYNPIQAVLRTKAFYREEDDLNKKARALLEIFDIRIKEKELAKNLPYGEQRKLEISRALATGAKLILLDEPAAGMNPQETNDLMHLIRFVRDKFKLSVLLIEHDMSLVMGICEKIVVLDYGQVIAVGTPQEISKNEKVIKAYLGEEANNA